MRLLMVVVILSSACFAQTPSGYNQWEISDNKYQSQFGGEFHNYHKPDQSWAEIESDWINEGDTLFTNYRSILQTDVTDKGQSRITLNYKGNTYTVTQTPKRLIWLKTDNWNWIDIFPSTTWPTPTVDDSVVSWSNIFPGVNYQIIKRRGAVPHRVQFKPAFLDSAVTLYNQRSDSQTIALGNVIEYSLTGVDDADIGIGNVSKRILKKLKDFVFEISNQRLWHDTAVTDIPVLQRWVKVAGKIYCIEYVMMSDVKQFHEDYPTEIIWHNTETTVKPSTNDCYIYSQAVDDNYSTMTETHCWGHVVVQKTSLFYWDISSISSSDQLDSVEIMFRRESPNLEEQLYFARMTTEWHIDDDATWNNADDGNSTDWSSGSGGDYDSCGGAWMVWCDSLTDVGFNDPPQYNDSVFSKSTASDGLFDMVEDWIDGTYTNYGIAVQTSYTSSNYYITSEDETSATAQRPRITIWHSVPSEETPSTRRRKILTGGQ